MAVRQPSSFRPRRASSGVTRALIGSVPKILPRSTSSAPSRSIAEIAISSLLSAPKIFTEPLRLRCGRGSDVGQSLKPLDVIETVHDAGGQTNERHVAQRIDPV